MQSLEDVEILLQPASPPLPSEAGESSVDSPTLVYPPRLESTPKIKQLFDNLDAVRDFYNNYARECGFGTRTHTSKKNKDGEIVRQEYVCCKQGERKNSEQPIKRIRGITRENCGAKVVVVKDRASGGYVVSLFVEGHTHPLTTPSKVHLLISHRKVTPAQKTLTQQLADANVPTYQQMNILDLQAGGHENVGFERRDLYNYQRDKAKVVDGRDADMLYEFFESQQLKNPAFTFTCEKNDKGHLTRCFWADATSRQSYMYFGDVVVFDTTHGTNKYDMIFAPLLGVNHHRQTTIFGCALLSDETTESFEWLFKEWLKVMPAGPPKLIITDQDLVMTKAIANILPTTYHRYCIWHILDKFSMKIGAQSYVQHNEAFKDCI